MNVFTLLARAVVLFAGLLSLTSLTGCGGTQSIVGHWVHSHEEDSSGVQVYRPSTFGFPPAFGREALELRGDGSAVVYSIGPADGVEADSGRWSYSDTSRMLTITTGEASRPMRFEVAHVDSALLRLRILR